MGPSLSTLRILFIGDVIGNSGVSLLQSSLAGLQNRTGADVTILNAENASAGRGLTPSTAATLFGLGADVLTSGNHIWNKDKIFPVLEEQPFLIRPLNYPPGAPGHGSCVFRTSAGDPVGVLNLQGRSFMMPIDCPFRAADAEIERLNREGVRIIFVDFHAEATAEKLALGRYLDGRVTALVGTHTHVQTADEMLLPNGTAYITDAGMTGPLDSVIGMDTDSAILRFRSQLPVPYRASESASFLNGVLIETETADGKAVRIERLKLPAAPKNGGQPFGRID
jgi:2',3'-cyclic-nucleotide 2'-phosphodiesterase